MTKCSRKVKGGLVAFVAAIALCASLGAGTAFATGLVDVPGDGANWKVPTYSVTNTVWKDDNGNVVDEGTEGATQYKVLTTWAEQWATSGPDYIGISNSSFFGANGITLVQSYEQAQKSTTIGVWSTEANENANAYSWNKFYNYYAETSEGALAGAVSSDWATIQTGSNGGADWSTEAGVWCGFKYRPDIVWTNNSLSADAAAVYISQIRQGQYGATASVVTEGEGRNASSYYYADPVGEETDGTPIYDQSFYVYEDENYDPQIISANNNNAYSFVASVFELAAIAQTVTATTVDYEGLDQGEALDWKSVNKLPRSSRYSDDPTDCAVNIEKLAKGSVYYALAKIADGTVDRKKVAFVAYPWNYTEQKREGDGDQITDELHVITYAYDFTEGIGNGPMDGRVTWSAIAVDQLTTDDVYAAKSSSSASGTSSTTTLEGYMATADDLATCDVVFCGGSNIDHSAQEWQEWIETNASTQEGRDHAADIIYLNTWPCLTDGSNFTMEKLLYGALGMDMIYPELFPSMELSCWWCNKIYHQTESALADSMSWIYASSALPKGTDISNIPASYDPDELNAKFDEGLEYYENSLSADGTSSTDATIDRILHNIGFDGTTDINGSPYVFNGFGPSNFWLGNAFDATSVFSDVQDPTAWFYKAVCYVAANGLIVGYDNNDLYGVGDSLTRAQFATILWRNAEPEAAADYNAATAVNETGMSDVENGMYYTAAANWAVENGVINGFENEGGSRTFEPDTAVTFEQMMVILANYLSGGENQEYPTDSLAKFADGNDVDTWAASSLAWAKDKGFFSGYKNDDGSRTIEAYEEVGRERCATVLYNIILQDKFTAPEADEDDGN